MIGPLFSNGNSGNCPICPFLTFQGEEEDWCRRRRNIKDEVQ